MGGAHEVALDLPAGATLRMALTSLAEGQSAEFRDALFDPTTGQPLPHNQVLVNGRHYRYLLGGLDAALREGDLVSLFPPAAGGQGPASAYQAVSPPSTRMPAPVVNAASSDAR